MKNYKLALIFGAIALGTVFFHFLWIGTGFAIAAIVIGLEEYKKAKAEQQEINFKIQTGELSPEEFLLYDKTPKNFALTGLILGVVSIGLQILLVIATIGAAISNQIMDNMRWWFFF